MTRKQITSLILLAVSIIYDVIPADFIPDIPFIGWLDDMLITSSAAINCLQQFGINANGKVERLLKWLKWTCILLAVIIVLIAILLAGTIVSMVR
jgi:uncharacterized membrane protein YkvA (DUF1232 family)